MAEPWRVPVYVVEACDGFGCVELQAVTDAETPARAVRRLAQIARELRRRGCLGTLVLTEEATDRVVARRRIWPSPPDAEDAPR